MLQVCLLDPEGEGGSGEQLGTGEVVRQVGDHSRGAAGWCQWVGGSVGAHGDLQYMLACSVVMWLYLEHFGGGAGQVGSDSAGVSGQGCCWYLDSEDYRSHQADSRLFGLSGVFCLSAGVSCRWWQHFQFLHRLLSASWLPVLKPNRVGALCPGRADGSLTAS